VKIWKY